MRILFLSTWFPFPLWQGSKIRAYHLLKALAQGHEVALVSFEDAALQPTWVDHIRRFCSRVEVVKRDPFATTRLNSVRGWASLRPSAVVAGYSPEMAERVKRVASEWGPDLVVALTFVTAPYALEIAGIPRVIDIDNVMSRMLYEDYRRASRPLSRLRRWIAWQKFLGYEKWLYPQFDLSLVVSERDREEVCALLSLPLDRVQIISNGVDIPEDASGLPEPEMDTLIFNGALTYQANYDAMDYFLGEIFPLINSRKPGARLQISGRTKGVDFGSLPLNGKVAFTGYVEDIRPIVAGSWACVIPLRIGGGTRLKVLEAMALGTPVVSTSKGAEGLDVENGKHLLIADSPQNFAAQILRILGDPELRGTLAKNAARLVSEKYDWSKIESRFLALVEGMLSDPGLAADSAQARQKLRGDSLDPLRDTLR